MVGGHRLLAERDGAADRAADEQHHDQIGPEVDRLLKSVLSPTVDAKERHEWSQMSGKRPAIVAGQRRTGVPSVTCRDLSRFASGGRLPSSDQTRGNPTGDA